MLTLNDGRNELWQWDTGRTLNVDADCTQVHFSNKVFGRSIDMNVVDGIAIIPDILLQTDKDLIAWAFVGTAENGYTKISKVFKVNKRNKPADYVFTPPEQTSLEEIKEKIDYLESIQDPDAIKNAVEDYLDQNPVESPVQSVNGKTGKVKLTAEDVGAISQDDLQEATNKALEQAKESGEFKGDPGEPGQPGKDYILTPADKTEIAEMAAELVDVPDSGGNANLGVTGATVGQTVKISAVDENGVPTAWEPVNFPSGGGGGELPNPEFITEFSITEDGVKSIEILNGNVEYRDVYIFFNFDSNCSHAQTTEQATLIGRINDSWEVALGGTVAAMRAKYMHIDNMGMSENTDGTAMASLAGWPSYALQKGFSGWEKKAFPYAHIKKVVLKLNKDTSSFANGLHIRVSGVRA